MDGCIDERWVDEKNTYIKNVVRFDRLCGPTSTPPTVLLFHSFHFEQCHILITFLANLSLIHQTDFFIEF